MSASRDRGILADLERDIEQTEPALVAMYDKFRQVSTRTDPPPDAPPRASGGAAAAAKRSARAVGLALLVVIVIVGAFTAAVELARW